MKWFVFVCFFLENPIFSTDINVALYQDQCLFLETYVFPYVGGSLEVPKIQHKNVFHA